jgi:hypothetical protein
MGACNSTENKRRKEELQKERERIEQLRQEFINELLDEHNKIRSKHNVPPLKLDPELAKYSQEHASSLAARGVTRASPCRLGDKTLGENVTMSGGSILTPQKVIEIWLKEKENYNFKQPEKSNSTSRFTQLVWRDSEYIGIGIATLGQSTYVVTNYYPVGNKVGEYEMNVLTNTSKVDIF